MPYLSSLNECVQTLQHCNSSLESTTHALNQLTTRLPRLQTVLQTTRHYDLTTATDITRAQQLVSKEAVPFLFRQVDQLETAIEVIRMTHQTLEHKVGEQEKEYEELVRMEAQMNGLQKEIQQEQTKLSDVQTLLLNSKSLRATRERDLSELTKARSTVREPNGILEEAGRVEAEIIRVRRAISDIDHETQGIPLDDQIQGTQDLSDQQRVHDIIQPLLDNPGTLNATESAVSTLELLENKLYVPWWDHSTTQQTARLGALSRLLRFFYKHNGTTMHCVIELLLDSQSMTIDDLRRELSGMGHDTQDLPMLVNHLRQLGAVTTETTRVAGSPVMTIELDFSVDDRPTEAPE